MKYGVQWDITLSETIGTGGFSHVEAENKEEAQQAIRNSLTQRYRLSNPSLISITAVVPVFAA
jgi:hypothetical protein